MDLSYGPEYEAFRKEVHAFLADHWPPQGEEAERPRDEQVERFRDKAVDTGVPPAAIHVVRATSPLQMQSPDG